MREKVVFFIFLYSMLLCGSLEAIECRPILDKDLGKSRDPFHIGRESEDGF